MSTFMRAERTHDRDAVLALLVDHDCDTREMYAEYLRLGSWVGHAGDGNFHLMYLLNPDNPAEVDEARRLNEQLVQRALSMGGTCTGEHGVGYGKMKYMEAEHGAALDVMRTIKLALDPDNRMNPGKVLDAEGRRGNRVD